MSAAATLTGGRPADTATLWVYTHERIMIVARLTQLRSIDRLRASVREGEIFGAPAELLIHLLRAQADPLATIVRRSSTEVDRIGDQFLSRLTEQSNRTLFTLTLVTVLALPTNIIAGRFGMNPGGIPLAENRHGFRVMMRMVVSFTALAGCWGFRRRAGR